MITLSKPTTARMKNGENPSDKYGDYDNIFIVIAMKDGTPPFLAVYDSNWWCNDKHDEAWTVHPVHLPLSIIMPSCTVYPTDIKYWQFANHALFKAQPNGVYIIDRDNILSKEVT